jgi:hypothetical protein
MNRDACSVVFINSKLIAMKICMVFSLYLFIGFRGSFCLFYLICVILPPLRYLDKIWKV